MSAKDELMELRPDDIFTEARWGAAMDLILAMHAHELAEKIRASSRGLSAQTLCAGERVRAKREAADLIDPEVADG